MHALAQASEASEGLREFRMTTNGKSLQEALERGFAAQQAGRLAEAERIYKGILQVAPRSFDALHLLGVLKAASGAPEEADRLLKKALMVDPRSAGALNNRANVLQSLGRYEEALVCCTRALQIKPEFAEALNNQGNILHDLGRLEDALASLDRALALRPAYLKALNNRGIVLQDLKRLEEALACFDRAIAIDANSAEAHNNRGNVLHNLERLDEGLAALNRALALRPEYAKALHNKGMILAGLKRAEEALASFDKALAISPQSPETLNRRGLVLHELDRYGEAVVSFNEALRFDPHRAETFNDRARTLLSQQRYDAALSDCEQALKIKPNFDDALNSQGIALRESGRFDAALASFDEALALNPNFAEAMLNRGIVLRDLERYDEALSWIERALAIKPNWTNGLFHRANVLKETQQYDEALATYERTLAIDPEYWPAHWNEGLCRLLIGDMERGWEKYEWRWRAMKLQWQAKVPTFGMPHADAMLWLGKEDVAGKTLLLHGEQGLGDTLQFCRYVALVKSKGARIVLEVQPELVRLLRALDGADAVIARDEPPPPFDFHCPLMSLPLAFRTRVDTIPSDVPYLAADPELAAMWCERVKGLSGAKVGLVWSGIPSPFRHVSHRRSMQLAQLAPLAQVPGVAWISLQKGATEAQSSTPTSGMTLIDWTSELNDLADTAGLVQSLDLVISVDTSVAHLAGALGKPVWLFNRFDTCWRWLLSREDTPWYPTMRIFRQPRPGDWESVVERVAAELARWIADRCGLDTPEECRVQSTSGTPGPLDTVHVGLEAAKS
jgi:tetratricopeptide (TPR) repeat protein